MKKNSKLIGTGILVLILIVIIFFLSKLPPPNQNTPKIFPTTPKGTVLIPKDFSCSNVPGNLDCYNEYQKKRKISCDKNSVELFRGKPIEGPNIRAKINATNWICKENKCYCDGNMYITL